MPGTVSPLAPKSYPEMPAIAGVRLATAMAGIKVKGRTDLLLMMFDPDTSVAGVFTKSKCPSAPVDFCRQNLPSGRARALVVNSGNANAFTGMKGRRATEVTAEGAANAVKCDVSNVFLASTGVIGEPLNAAAFAPMLADMAENAGDELWPDAARAIMTTDTYPKMATARAKIGGNEITINGIAKGAGMIAPDMATMLSFIATDAPLSPQVLQALISEGVGSTFNAVTVDSDTSTSDTVLVFATGAASARGVRQISDPNDPDLMEFKQAFDGLLHDLAQQIVRDGEGARKLVEIEVSHAVSDESAGKIARSIANSPLFKTAIAGEDANWGRVVMAVGKAGEPADRDRLAIWFGDYRVAFQGERDQDYSEEAVSEYMKNEEITLRVDMGLGKGKAKVWTCDLTKEYVAINGDYRS